MKLKEVKPSLNETPEKKNRGLRFIKIQPAIQHCSVAIERVSVSKMALKIGKTEDYGL